MQQPDQFLAVPKIWHAALAVIRQNDKRLQLIVLCIWAFILTGDVTFPDPRLMIFTCVLLLVIVLIFELTGNLRCFTMVEFKPASSALQAQRFTG